MYVVILKTNLFYTIEISLAKSNNDLVTTLKL